MIQYIKSSLGQKQLIAVTGIGMVLFLIAHLIGNLLIFKGPDALNDYSKTLHDLGALLWVARIGLLAFFLIHFMLVAKLVIQNIKARAHAYSMPLHKSTRSLFTKLMRYSGVIIFVYIFWHLYDYTFTPPSMDNAVIDGVYYGLYGHLYNSFLNPIRSVFYIVTMFAIGAHLIHGVHSVIQTFGFNHPVYTPMSKKVSWALAAVIALGFSAIPLYVVVHHQLNWSI